MSNLQLYFEKLQFTVNILTSIDWMTEKVIIADSDCVGNALYELLSVSLIDELSEKDGKLLFERYSQQNRAKCNRDKVISFLDFGEDEINPIINKMMEKSPILKRLMEDNVLYDEDGIIENGWTSTEVIRDLYLEKREELFIACGQSPKDTSTEQEQTVKKLPPELDTLQAHIIWSRAKHNGWIDDNYNFIGTKYQMAYAAKCMGKALKLKPKWRPFEILWNYKYFPQTRYESKERIGKVERDKEIEVSFSL